MKKQILGFIALIVLLGSMVQTTQANDFPGGGNPFGFPNDHPGIDPYSLHEPVWRNCTRVCSGNSVVGQVISGYKTCIFSGYPPNCE